MTKHRRTASRRCVPCVSLWCALCGVWCDEVNVHKRERPLRGNGTAPGFLSALEAYTVATFIRFWTYKRRYYAHPRFVIIVLTSLSYEYNDKMSPKE